MTEKSGIHANNPDNNYYIMVFCVSSLAFLLALFLKAYLFVKLTLKASSKLHDRVFAQVIRATMAFFDVTPTGRILNRFSKDLDEIDAQLPWTLEAFIQNILRILISIGLVAIMFPWFLLAVVPLMIIFFVLNKYFRKSVRELKRLDGVTRSPIFTHLTATIQGLSTLHAFDKMAEFNETFKGLVDNNTLPFFMYFASNRWLSVRLDLITIIITVVTALLVVLTKGTLPAAFAGLALSYAIRVSTQNNNTQSLNIYKLITNSNNTNLNKTNNNNNTRKTIPSPKPLQKNPSQTVQTITTILRILQQQRYL